MCAMIPLISHVRATLITQSVFKVSLRSKVSVGAITHQVVDLNRSLVTSTAAIAGFSSVLFGFLTNMPVALAPGMGLNAYFAYQVVGYHGSGVVPYNLALTAVFVEGFIFVGLSLLGMRQWLVKVIPNSLKIATACGIGLFLALIGLSSSDGIGAISGAQNTPLELAGCPDQYKDASGICTSHKMTSPTVSQRYRLLSRELSLIQMP